MSLKKISKKTSSLILSWIKANKSVLLILIIAALLRFTGIYPGYNQYHADEGITYSAASSMVRNNNLDPLRYDYPAIVPDINFFFFELFFVPIGWIWFYISHILDFLNGSMHFPLSELESKKVLLKHILGDRYINALFWSRFITASFSIANVFLTYMLARDLFRNKIKNSEVIALLAAFLLTFNYKHVINSHIGLPDIYNAFFVLVVLIMAVKIWNSKVINIKKYLLTGFLVGMSFSVKYQIFAIFPFLLAHLFSAIHNKDGKFTAILIGKSIDIKRLFHPITFLSMVIVPLTFALFNPYFFIHLDSALSAIKMVSQKYGVGANELNLYPFSYFFHIDYGFLEFGLVLIGLLIMLWKFKLEGLLLLSFVFPFMYSLIYYSKGGFYIRNFITVTPIFMIFAAVAIWQIHKTFLSQLKIKYDKILIVALLSIVVFIPARNSIISSFSYTQPWGYDNLRPWIEKNLPNDVTIAAHPFDARNLNIKNKRTEFEIAGAYSLAEHAENGATYALMDLNWAGNPFYFWMSYGFEDLKLYWGKPLDILRNIFHGIAAEELFRYQLVAVTKPWQSPDTHLIVAKLPEWPKVEMTDIKNFSFDQSLEEWNIYGKDGGMDNGFAFDGEKGYGEKGSVVYYPFGSKYPTIRLTSKPIPIRPGHLYILEGYLKTDKLLGSREREGYLRADFYGKEVDLEKRGVISTVSSRVYGTKEWVKKEIIERAPEDAKFLTVSIGAYQTLQTKLWLDDVRVLESIDEIEDITSKPPYKHTEIDLNYLYPNSHGNL